MKLWLKSLVWPFIEIDTALPRQGLILDLGCGDGMVAAYLAKSSPQRQVIGLDFHPPQRSPLPNLEFRSQNILQANLKSAVACVLSDVLHHLLPSQQQLLLERLSRQLKPGSVCVIKEVNTDDWVRTHLTRLWDWLLYPQDQINYHAAGDLIKRMQHLGFSVEFKPVRRLFPGSVNLFICTKL